MQLCKTNKCGCVGVEVGFGYVVAMTYSHHNVVYVVVVTGLVGVHSTMHILYSVAVLTAGLPH